MDAEQPMPEPPAWYGQCRGLVSAYLHQLLDPLGDGVYDLCRYHLGWSDEAGTSTAGEAGKMLRPVLCLVTCSGFGEIERAVGGGAALELLHAFSLVHDDIEDGDRERRHRPTVWAIAGVPLAVNAGDALFTLAYRALHEGMLTLPGERIPVAHRLFTDACLRMIEGQHLDIEFEARPVVSSAEYLAMARRKTGALIGASLAIGALCGGAPIDAVQQLEEAGIELGLGFQATDDLLAFWGDPAQTGKATGNDLARGKKSLPVVLAAERGLAPDGLKALPLVDVIDRLERAGVREAVEQFATARSANARQQIEAVGMSAVAYQRLEKLVEFAVTRVA